MSPILYWVGMALGAAGSAPSWAVPGWLTVSTSKRSPGASLTGPRMRTFLLIPRARTEAGNGDCARGEPHE